MTTAGYIGDRSAKGYQDLFTAGSIINVVTPQSIRDLKVRLDPNVRALDAEVAACDNLPPEKRLAYQAFSASWRLYFDTPEPSFFSFGLGTIFDTGLAYEGQITAWEKDLSLICTPASPGLVPHGGDPKPLFHDGTQSLITVGLIVAGLGIIVYAIKK